MVSKVKKLYFFLFFVICLVNCQKNSEHFEYWKNFFEFQNSIRKHLEPEKKWQIANGTLNPKYETLLQKTKDEKLALLWNIIPTNSKFQLQQIDLTNREANPLQFENYLLVEYTPTKFKNTETYVFHRSLQYQSTSVYHTTDFLKWVHFLQLQVAPNQFFLNSPLGNFLCSVFECRLESNSDTFQFIFKPTKKLKELDKSFYEKLNKLLKSKFELKFFEKGNLFLKIKNEVENLEFIWSKTPISENPSKIQLYINFNTTIYGLNIDIKDWIYELEFGSAGRSSYLKGRFANIPKYSLTGRLAYILPKQILNLFIPENIDDYMKTFFDLRLNGNYGKGNQWQIVIQPYFKYYRITSKIESESPRKLFRFWSSSSNEKDDSEIFEETFKQKILESLNERINHD